MTQNTTYHFDDHAQSIAKRQYMQPSDIDVYGMFQRIANWVSSAEATPELKAKWGATFYDLMASKRFCPGGRVLAGAGTQHGNVLNCFVQGATEFEPSSFEGVMEVAKKLALVTKVGGGNGVNLDVYTPRATTSRSDNGVRGWAYMNATHPDVEDFIKGLMRPPTMPDGEKQPTSIRNWSKVVYGVVAPALSSLARQHGVNLVGSLPDNVRTIHDDMGGILEAAKLVCATAKAGNEPRIDLSGLREEGAPIKGSGGTSSGPVSFLFEIFDNFLEWANLGAEASGPVATLRYCYAPVLRVVRQGGCLHPDTLVHTSKGTLRLAELVDPYITGWQHHALEVATDEGWKHSPETFNNGIANTLKVALENGLSVQGTPNHKLKVMRQDGTREWVKLSELKKGDYVIQSLDHHTGSSVQLQPLEETDLHFNATRIQTPETLTEDLAFWLGYLWGDGFISTGGRIGMCAAHGSIMETKVPEMFQTLFSLEVSTQQKENDKSVVFVVKSAALTTWLEKNGLLKPKAEFLEVPRAIRQAPRHILGAYLRGVFEADGTLSHHYPELSSVSRRFVEDLAVLLAGLGIPSQISDYAAREDRYSSKPYARIRVTSHIGFERFKERIGWEAGSRFVEMNNFTPDLSRESAWVLPHAQGLLENTFNQLPKGSKGHPSPQTQNRKTLSRYMRGERQLTLSGYAALTQTEVLEEMLPAMNTEECYVAVSSITEAGRILTLDLSVNENHTYVANGMVSHNTRRGAGMATISIDHPDVLDFLTAKDLDRETGEGDISTFNISILPTEKFWNTLQADGLWNIAPLEVMSKYHIVKLEGDYRGSIPELPTRALDGAKGVPVYVGGIPAKWLWRQIAEHAWATGEPGLIYIDKVNELSAVKNLGERYQIKSTNPCFAAGTTVMTRDGVKNIETLVGEKVQIWTGTRWQSTEFQVTGKNQEIWELELTDGITVQATPYHKFILENGERIALKDIQPNQRLKATVPEVELALAGYNGIQQQSYQYETSIEGLLGDSFTVIRVTPHVFIATEVYCCNVIGEHSFALGFGLLVGNCGEIPLTVGEPCDLGAINLAAYVQNNTFDYSTFRTDVRDCIRFLDDVLDVNVFALEDNRVASQNLRRLGLGVMGLADALILLGQRYDNQQGRDTIHKIMSVMREEAVAESQNLGFERGVYPVFEQNMDKIPHAPRRNVAVLTVAPTGTTSMLMGVSSGIEPVFSPFVWRKIGAEYKALIAPLFQELLEQYPAHAAYAKNNAWDWDKVTDAIASNHGSCVGLEFVPDAVQSVFVCAHDIAPLDHVRMQGTVQQAFDAEGFAANSLSKTINLPNSATVEDVEAAYSEAYRTGCKGITVYRDGSRQFQVLSTSKEEKKEEVSNIIPLEPNLNSSIEETLWGANQSFQPGSPIFSRPARLTGVTDMVKLTDLAAGTKRTFLITTNTLEGKPVEIVVVSGRAGDEANADSEALGRVVSIALQYGVPAEAIQKTLRGINGGLYGSYNGRLVGSKADLIAVALESTASSGAVRPAEQPLLYTDMQTTYPAVSGAAPSAEELQAPLFSIKGQAQVAMKGEKCPSCSSPNLVREEGCLKCQSCGYSKCG
jgi:ribonucleotide reductase alpha subunit